MRLKFMIIQRVANDQNQNACMVGVGGGVLTYWIKTIKSPAVLRLRAVGVDVF